MTNQASLRCQLFSAWCGLAFLILYPLFWAWYGHTQPPLSPTLSAPEVAAFYQLHHDDVLFGMSLAAVIGALWVPWTAQLTIVMLRIEGKAPVLTLIQLMGGALTAWVLVFTPAMWATAAFRPDADPSIVRAFSDIGYMTFNLTYAVTTVQAVAAGLVGLADKSAKPVFPRWACCWAIFTGLSFFSVTALAFVKTGPMALNGLFVGWVPGSAYFIWTGTMGFFMVRDAHRRLSVGNNDPAILAAPAAG